MYDNVNVLGWVFNKILILLKGGFFVLRIKKGVSLETKNTLIGLFLCSLLQYIFWATVYIIFAVIPLYTLPIEKAKILAIIIAFIPVVLTPHTRWFYILTNPDDAPNLITASGDSDSGISFDTWDLF